MEVRMDSAHHQRGPAWRRSRVTVEESRHHFRHCMWPYLSVVVAASSDRPIQGEEMANQQEGVPDKLQGNHGSPGAKKVCHYSQSSRIKGVWIELLKCTSAHIELRLKIMEEKNETMSYFVHLLGFQTPPNLTFFVFFLFLVLYCVTICGNLLIITLVSYSKALHSPMYFFLSHLSVSDVILITDILTGLLHIILMKETKILLSECISQFYFFGIIEALECLLLSVMSYDRYLAICKPLHYTLIMSPQLCWLMVITCWILSNLVMLIQTITISKLHFCGPGVIDHFFCDLDPILGLACSDTAIVHLEVLSLGAFVVVIPFFIIVLSYVYIIFTILNIPSITGRQKVFSTCSSHLTVVFIYYGSLGCVYMVPNRGQPWNISKFLSSLYTVGTPLLNPIIYSLRNEELTKVVGKFINDFLMLPFNRKQNL
ncbi:olfactory receptor 11A1-like [Mantella aurantiaca]